MKAPSKQTVRRFHSIFKYAPLFALLYAGAVAGQDVNSDPSLKNNLLCWYAFDSNFNDSHGAMNLTVTNGSPGFGKDRFGNKKGAFFTTGGNALSVNGTIALNSKTFSLQFWTLNPSSWFLAQGTAAANLGMHVGIIGTSLCWAFYNNDLQCPLDPTTNAGWTHWVLTYNATTKKKSIWRNGKLGHDTTTAAFAGTGTFYIGRHYNAAMTYSGSLDDVAIWARELTADEVTTLYANGKGLVYKNSTAIVTGPAHNASPVFYSLYFNNHLMQSLQTGPIARAFLYSLTGRLIAESPVNNASIRWEGASRGRRLPLGTFAFVGESASGNRSVERLVVH
jgi:hypothetical protein